MKKAYLKMPVSVADKRELNKKGYQVVDIKFKELAVDGDMVGETKAAKKPEAAKDDAPKKRGRPKKAD